MQELEKNCLGTMGKTPFGFMSCARALAPCLLPTHPVQPRAPAWAGSRGSWAPPGTRCPVPRQQAQPPGEMDPLWMDTWREIFYDLIDKVKPEDEWDLKMVQGLTPEACPGAGRRWWRSMAWPGESSGDGGSQPWSLAKDGFRGQGGMLPAQAELPEFTYELHQTPVLEARSCCPQRKQSASVHLSLPACLGFKGKNFGSGRFSCSLMSSKTIVVTGAFPHLPCLAQSQRWSCLLQPCCVSVFLPVKWLATLPEPWGTWFLQCCQPREVLGMQLGLAFGSYWGTKAAASDPLW